MPLEGVASAARDLCAPPGAGWATSTGGVAPLAFEYHSRRFGSTDPEIIRRCWRSELDDLDTSVAVVGVPFDGASVGLTGAAAGPLGIRWADPALTAGAVDLGDIIVIPSLHTDELLTEEALLRIRSARFDSARCALPVSPLSATAHLAAAAAAADLPLVAIGGDHSITAPLLGAHPDPLAILHVDGHDDLGSGRWGIDLLHSSWLTVVCRSRPRDVVVQVGGAATGRDADWLGSRLMRPLHPEPMAVIEEAIAHAAHHGITNWYVSVDIDALEARSAPATGLPAPDGLPLDAVLDMIDALAARCSIVGADVVEVAPPLTGTRNWSEDLTCRSAGAIVRRLIAACRSTAHATRGAGSSRTV